MAGKSGGLPLWVIVIGAYFLVTEIIPFFEKLPLAVIGVSGAAIFVAFLAYRSIFSKSDSGPQKFEPPVNAPRPSPPAAGHRFTAAEPPKPSTPVNWIPAGQSVNVGGITIPGGLLYVGSRPLLSNGTLDPGVIDPDLPLPRRDVNSVSVQLGYYPSYSEIEPAARLAYLKWLAGGRNDRHVQIGFVFLFFYGLERRVLTDAPTDPAARAGLPMIAGEIHRLLGQHGGNRSFQKYATGLLDVIQILQSDSPTSPLSSLPPALPVDASMMELEIKIGVGRHAEQEVPLPAEWAAAWILSGSGFSRGTAARKQPDLFYRALVPEIRNAYPDGIRLARNRTKIATTYLGASKPLAFKKTIVSTLPDVSALVSPTRELQAICNRCEQQLGRHVRSGATAGKTKRAESRLELPLHLWPAPSLQSAKSLQEQTARGLHPISHGDLVSPFGLKPPITRRSLVALSQGLRSGGVGIEPDLGVGKAMTPTDQVVLFALKGDSSDALSDPSAHAAAIMLDLGCAVALADGTIGASEMRLLLRQIEGWAGLTENHRARLRARLRRAILQPPSTRGVFTKLGQFDEPVRKALGHVLASIAQVDGEPSPDEVKLVEKAYKALGLEAGQAYTDLHALSTAAPVGKSPTAAPAARTASSGPALSLDRSRIATIQQETDQVAALLAKVFTEDLPPPPPAPTDLEDDEVGESPTVDTEAEPVLLPGLDGEHAAFLKLLLTRPSWSRAELEDVAADRDLMLDGALERINEAAFDAYDEALVDGEDPVEVKSELVTGQATD